MVHKRPVRRLYILDVNLAALLPYLGVQTRQDFAVEIGVALAGLRFGIRLAADFDLPSGRPPICTHLLALWQMNHLHRKRLVNRPHVQARKGTAPLLIIRHVECINATRHCGIILFPHHHVEASLPRPRRAW